MPELAPVIKAIFCARSCDMRASILCCVQWRVRLGDAVLSYGPVLVGESRFLRSLQHIGKIVGESQANAGIGSSFAREPRVLDAKRDRRAGMLRPVENGLAVVLVKLRLKECAVDGLMKKGRRDALRFGIDEGLGERLDHRCDHEVAAELERVRLPRLARDNGKTT